ncbi:hypothetical protein SPRG_02870 [Saprolegnia parasitica CBS 223.65]|uniref:PH domain-containing protein n=1 Tax=Saprolegnia parasitica (strain CBS 223.65) TaxID=695850 RepID=A0A067CPF9_SAPPC|nr:hypothetical protein SPRG_02870 [Saprolegnia parasitica CBS 223.65]KDO32393.1 hypothetical protein SPRG_02870 [Saprolegnia parasitica CBS 223.65]|eukprot:XP_012196847.1 hypothetical protein SPRG_02870 [Saprolegnia parasitica CBS 223.65]
MSRNYVDDDGATELSRPERANDAMDLAPATIKSTAVDESDPAGDALDDELEQATRAAVKLQELYIDIHAGRPALVPPPPPRDVYLNASLQLLHQQSDMRQRIRGLWFLAQRLRWDNHMDAHAMEHLRADLVQTMKSLGIEKQDGDRVRKTGHLVLLEPSVRAGPPPRVYCTLYEDESKLELVLPRVSTTPSGSSSLRDSFTSLSKLSSSLAWLLHDDPDDPDCLHVPLYGAQVHATSAEALEFRLDVLHRSSTSDAIATRSFYLRAETDDEYIGWMVALEAIARYDLFQLQASMRRISDPQDYVCVLRSFCPISVPLAWQRHRIARDEKQSGLTRRDSKNMPMLQVLKDVERDTYVVDGRPLSTADGIHHVISHLLTRIMAFLHADDDSMPSVASPAARMAKSTEAKALSFVERVLRGSTRTQSGGDIYDAISILCANAHVVVCPVSADASPVTLTVDVTNVLTVHASVQMAFRVMAPDATGDWARLHGALTRSFTYGGIAQPGVVTIEMQD